VNSHCKSIPPHSIEAEQAVLGALLIDTGAIDDIIDIIRVPEAFYIPKHQLVWIAILQLYNAGKPSDITTVSNQLNVRKKLEKAGGRSYLAELASGTATTCNIVSHAGIIREKHNLRLLIKEFGGIIDSANEMDIESAELINLAEQTLLKLMNLAPISVKPIGQVTADFLAEALSSDKKKLTEECLESRITDLNEKIVGIFKRELTVISGPPSMGKTAFAIDWSMYNSVFGRKVLYFCIDQDERSMSQRLLTLTTGIDRRRFYRGELSNHEKDTLAQAAAKMCDNDRFQICHNVGLTVLDIRSIARRIKRQGGLDAIVVDYMQQISPHRKFETRNLEVTEQCRILKDIAMELHIAVIALSQLSRDYRNLPLNPDKKQFGFPSAAMLRDSGSIEQEANLILFVWNILQALRSRGISEEDPVYENELKRTYGASERAFIVVAKQKDGPTGEVECLWDPVKMQFHSGIIEDTCIGL